MKCWKCGKYHSTIKAMKMHKRACVEYEGESDDGESEEREDEKTRKIMLRYNSLVTMMSISLETTKHLKLFTDMLFSIY